MKSKTKLLSLASAAGLASVVGLVSCVKDELKEAAGEYLGFTTSVTRATPTTLKNLDGFYVYADADGYKSLLIDGLKATKKENSSGDYVLEKNVIWPADVDKIRFWAYGPSNVKDKLTADINASTQALRNIEVKSDFKNGGKEHQDLVVTYTHAERDKVSGMRVPLAFHHAMSQIEVRLKLGAGVEDGRIVKVKGAWMMNVHSKGTLTFDKDSENNNHMKWVTSDPVNYGRYIDEGVRLSSNSTVNMISNEDGSANSSLMVLPQKFVKYQFSTGIETTADEESSTANIGNNPSGTYIMLLCRVETEHRTTTAGGEDNQAHTGTKPIEEGGKVVGHVHQLFPISKNNVGNVIFKEDAYGYTCVPIEGEWLPGKKYIYTLEFCGSDSGAGVYPPEPLPNEPEGEKRPDDKDPGDPVLDSPITFGVTIEDWTDETKPTPMP